MASPKADSSAESDSSSLHEDPSTRPEAERSQWRGGYDCQFVGEILPEEGECPICDLIYSDPHQMRCCGKRICGGCVEKIKAKSQPCPFCKEVDVSPYPDKAHMQSLGSYKVNCPNRSKGCEWEGQLSDLDRHLNLAPTTEKQLKGCPFFEIQCRFCFKSFECRFINNHQSRECPKRPYECEYCKYSASFDEVTQQHSNECPSAPVTCPNNCEIAVLRCELEHHRNHDCPLEMQQCEFCAVGCQVELPRRDMPEHKRQSVVEHSVALSTTMQKAIADITSLQGDNTTLQGDSTSLRGDITTLQRDSISFLGHITTLQGDITTLQGDSTSLQGDITSLQGDSTFLQGDITTLQGDSTSLQGDITTLQGDITSLHGDITSLQGDITTLQGDSTSLRGDITSLQGGSTSLRGDITSLQGDSTSLRGDITTLQGAITTQQGKMQAHVTQKTSAMQESLDKIQERMITQNERIKGLCVVVVLLAIVAVVSIALLAVVVTEQSGQHSMNGIRYREDQTGFCRFDDCKDERENTGKEGREEWRNELDIRMEQEQKERRNELKNRMEQEQKERRDELKNRMKQEQKERRDELKNRMKQEQNELNRKVEKVMVQVSEYEAAERQERQRLQGQLSELQDQLDQDIKTRQKTDIEHKVTGVDVNMLQVRQNAILKHLQMFPHEDILPFEFEMKEFKNHRRNGDLWYSPPFYTDINGYKMCIRVEVRGKDGKYVSVTVFLMAGVADDDLKWPFREDITIELINQASSSRWNPLSYFRSKKESHFKTLEFESNRRVTSGERALDGLQISRFIAHDNLEYDSEEGTQYLKDDTLKFRISASSSY